MGLKNFGFIADEYVVAVREQFMEDSYYGNEEDFYDEDIKKIVHEDWYIKRFIISAYKKQQDAVDNMTAAMKWRKEQGIRELKDNDFPREFFETGALFQYESDKNGSPSLIMRLKFVKRVSEMIDLMKKFCLYHCFKIDEETDGKGWVLVLDFTDCSYTQYQNIDLLHYFISTMHHYFPAGMDYVLSVNMPWIFSSFWGFVKGWIPEKRRDMVQFCTKGQLLDYFDKEHLPPVLGGICKRKYKVCPANCPTAWDVGAEMGIDRERCDEIYQEYQPLLDECALEDD